MDNVQVKEEVIELLQRDPQLREIEPVEVEVGLEGDEIDPDELYNMLLNRPWAQRSMKKGTRGVVVGFTPPQDFADSPRRVGRNSPCPCESGRKYKRCCGK